MSQEGASIKEAFEKFDRENPRVFAMFVRFARELKANGHGRGGAKMIWERLRWEVAMETQATDGFKLNNNYTAHYARKAESECPDLAGFFVTRESPNVNPTYRAALQAHQTIAQRKDAVLKESGQLSLFGGQA